MDAKFNNREIILGRLPQNKVVPILITKINDEIFGLQLYTYNPNKRENSGEIFIGRPKNLNFDSAINITQKIPPKNIHKIKVLSHLNTKQYNKIINKYNNPTQGECKNYKQLQKERRDLELELCIINNEKYDLKGQKIKKTRKRKGTRRSLDYIEPIHTPYITVYRF